VSYIILAEKP